MSTLDNDCSMSQHINVRHSGDKDNQTKNEVCSVNDIDIPTVRMIGNNENQCKTATINVLIEDIAVTAVLDTGAQATVISNTCWNKLRCNNKHGNHVSLNQADGSTTMQAVVYHDIKMTLGTFQCKVTLHVADIADELLLGLDILWNVGAIVNLEDELLKVKTSQIPIHILSDNMDNSRTIAYINQRVILDPGEEKAVSVTSPIRLVGNILFSPSKRWSFLAIPEGLFQGNSRVVQLPITNMSYNRLTLKAGIALGSFEVVSVFTHQDTMLLPPHIRTINKKNSSRPLQEHIRPMADNAKKGLPLEEIKHLDALLKEYSDIFSKHEFDLGCFSGVEHTIDTGDAKPIRQSMRRTPMKFQNEEEKHLQKMLKAKVIEPSSSDWCHPPVLVRKKDSGVRWCVDYRLLNNVTTRDAFPLPLIEECFDALEGMKYMSSLDLSSGYWQLSVAEEDRPKTAFITKYGLFQHTRMGFGLCNAPATFQRAMQHVLRGLQWDKVLVYLDDVIVLGRDISEHFENLRCVFQRFRQHNLKLKASKCQLLQRELKFLGWDIGPQGVSIPLENIQALLERPVPRTIRDVQSFVGYINYHRNHLKGCAEAMACLHTLAASKEKTFQWTELHQLAFERLKLMMTTAPVMRIPNRTGLFILDTDASNTAIGAELSQVQDEEEYVIAYGSYVLQPTQRSYCTTRKELLAIVRFTRQFRHYLLGDKFLIRTDHSSLAWLMRFKNAEGQLARWLEELSQYDMNILHRPGKLHVNADYLSRPTTNCDCYSAGTKLETLPCKGCKYCRRAMKTWVHFNEEVDNVLPLASKGESLINISKEHENSKIRSIRGTINSEEEPNWCNIVDITEIRDQQCRDIDLSILWKWLESATKPSQQELAISSLDSKFYWRNRSDFFTDNKVIYYKSTEFLPLLVVPYSMRDQILIACHGQITASHLSADKTFAALRQYFYWRGSSTSCKLFVGSCAICSLNKGPGKAPKAQLITYHAGTAMERVHVDILGPFPESYQHNIYILMVVDQFTKWLECYPMPDQTAETVARNLVDNFISRKGSPMFIHTDQGRQFDGELFAAVCKLLEIAKTRTTPTHPASNGQVERYNKTLLSLIRCHLNDGDDRWDENLPLLAGAIRSMKNRHTGFSANMMMLGRETRKPLDLIFSQVDSHQISTSDYVRKLVDNLHRVHSDARDQLATSLKVQKDNYDCRALVNLYQPGDLVYRANIQLKKGQCSKLQPKGYGPFLILKVLSEATYSVRGQKKTSVLHHNILYPCKDRTIPFWMRRLRHRFFFDLPLDGPEEIQDLNEFWELVEHPTVKDIREPYSQSLNDLIVEDMAIIDNHVSGELSDINSITTATSTTNTTTTTSNNITTTATSNSNTTTTSARPTRSKQIPFWLRKDYIRRLRSNSI